MRDLVTTLPGVEKIYILPQTSVSEGADLASMSGSPILLPLEKTEVEFYDEPTLSLKTSTDNNGPVSELTLSFKTAKSMANFGYCYAVKCVSGDGYLLGSYERGPLVENSESSGTPSNGARVKTYTITYKCAGNPLICVL